MTVTTVTDSKIQLPKGICNVIFRTATIANLPIQTSMHVEDKTYNQYP